MGAKTLAESCIFNINIRGGKIYGNSSLCGGGVNAEVSNGSIYLSGGRIYGNNATVRGGGAEANYDIKVSGAVRIEDNVAGGTKDPETGLYTGGTPSNVAGETARWDNKEKTGGTFWINGELDENTRIHVGRLAYKDTAGSDTVIERSVFAAFTSDVPDEIVNRDYSKIFICDFNTDEVAYVPMLLKSTEYDSNRLAFQRANIVTFNTNGGNEPEKQFVVTGGKATVPTDAVKEGHTLAGWYTTPGCEEGSEWSFEENTIEGNITLYAKWQVNQYTLTFVTDNGSDPIVITQDYGTAVTAPAVPAKTGYTFIGWDKEVPATMPAEDMTFTAQWTENRKPMAFLDVPESAYYYEPVDWAVANGITNGKTETLFAPEDACTRGQIVTFLYRANNK